MGGGGSANWRDLGGRGGALLLVGAFGCHGAAPSLCDALPAPAVTNPGHNVLVILTDDIGIDKTAAYGEHPSPPRMPNVDQLAREGILFRNAYANPSCSASRASLLTGRHASRTGLGHWIYGETDTADLDLSEVTIPEMLTQGGSGYSSAAVGKWHLVVFGRDGVMTHPLDQGFSCFAGSLGNPLDAAGSGHEPRGYTNWEKTVDGEAEFEHTYMPTDTTDEALARIRTLPSPWFLYVAYNSSHTPVGPPPPALTTMHVDGHSSEIALFAAMTEAVDTEIGRLLRGIPDDVRADTTVVYLSDNGTPYHDIMPPWDQGRGKMTVYEGGVNVPMIVTGPDVAQPGTVSDALVHFVDLFPTVAEIAGVDLGEVLGEDGEPVELDGGSLLPYLADSSAPSSRSTVYTEGFFPNGFGARDYHERMVRNADWKLIRHESGGTYSEEFFAMDPDSWDEGADLFEGAETGFMTPALSEALERLRTEMAAKVALFP